MGDPNIDPVTALKLLHVLLYFVACLLIGAASIALSLYILLLWKPPVSNPEESRCGAPRSGDTGSTTEASASLSS